MSEPLPSVEPEAVVAATRDWLERAVIGLTLCPFAKPAFAQERIRYVVSAARDEEALLGELLTELSALAETDPSRVETTLLIHPEVLSDFLDYNDFLEVADLALSELDLVGELQIASFHPDYLFAGNEPDDLANYVARSPFPMLHLLREASVERALESFPDAARIVERNKRTLRTLGLAGFQRVLRGER